LTLRQFWPLYVGEHRNATSRRLHFVGTAFTLVLLGAALAWRQGWLLALIPPVGYSFAWIGHFGFEKNRPATFRHPWLSLVCDYKMFWLMASGRMTQEIERLTTERPDRL
jgi:hypothetical protein